VFEKCCGAFCLSWISLSQIQTLPEVVWREKVGLLDTLRQSHHPWLPLLERLVAVAQLVRVVLEPPRYLGSESHHLALMIGLCVLSCLSWISYSQIPLLTAEQSQVDLQYRWSRGRHWQGSRPILEPMVHLKDSLHDDGLLQDLQQPLISMGHDRE